MTGRRLRGLVTVAVALLGVMAGAKCASADERLRLRLRTPYHSFGVPSSETWDREIGHGRLGIITTTETHAALVIAKAELPVVTAERDEARRLTAAQAAEIATLTASLAFERGRIAKLEDDLQFAREQAQILRDAKSRWWKRPGTWFGLGTLAGAAVSR